jgi:hypothetical protein
LGDRQSLESARVVRKHDVGFVTEHLSDAEVAVFTAGKRHQRVDCFTRDARLLGGGYAGPAPPIERKHAVENPPAFQRFIDIGVTHESS